MLNCEDVYLLTPSNVDTHSDEFGRNEASLIDWKGEMVNTEEKKRILLSEVDGELTWRAKSRSWILSTS